MFDCPPRLPDDDVLLALLPSQLAEPLLAWFRWHLTANPNGVHRPNFLRQMSSSRSVDVGRALAEAWSWLDTHGLIVCRADDDTACVFVEARAGLKIDTETAFAAFRAATVMPRDLLHQAIVDRAWANYLTGDYDTAVFAAFKAVEVAVAQKSRCEGTGVALVRAAFHKITGPLSDMSSSEGEREGLGQLFAGAFATFRNPAGHRDVTYKNPKEPAEQLVIASHLMRIVDASTARRDIHLVD